MRLQTWPVVGLLAAACAATPKPAPEPHDTTAADASRGAPAATAPFTTRPIDPGVIVRVASFNILAALKGVDQLASAIAALDADLVGLQEVDRGTRRGRGVDVAAELARRLDRHYAFARAMDYEGGEYGVALLARTPLTRFETHALPGADGAEPRVLLMARTEIGGARWTVGVTHLASHLDGATPGALRRLQARAVAEHLGGRDRCVLLGDLNQEADSAELAPLSLIGAFAGLDAGASYPARAPRTRLDHVLHSADLIALRTRLVDTGASDHRAVVVELAPRGADVQRAGAPETGGLRR